MNDDDLTLRIERLLDAPPEAVFEAWTTREAMEQWYRDRPEDVVRVLELEVRVGGGFLIEFGPADEPPYVERGRYLEIDAPHRLVISETLDAPDGNQWTETTVTVTFEDRDGKTALVLVHEGLPSREHLDGAAGGWPGFIDRVERLVARRSS